MRMEEYMVLWALSEENEKLKTALKRVITALDLRDHRGWIVPDVGTAYATAKIALGEVSTQQNDLFYATSQLHKIRQIAEDAQCLYDDGIELCSAILSVFEEQPNAGS